MDTLSSQGVPELIIADQKNKKKKYSPQYLKRLNFGYLLSPTHFHVRSGLVVGAIIIFSIKHKKYILTLSRKSGICGEL